MVGNVILILGGTREAIEIAFDLEQIENTTVVTSLAGVTRSPRLPNGKVRYGGFGGKDGLFDYIIREKITLVIDATHPFAEKITKNASEASKRANIPFLCFSRKPWKKTAQDKWYEVENSKAAASTLTQKDFECAKNIFLTIGRKDVNCFYPIKTKQFFVRSIEPVKELACFDNMRWIQGRGPFTFQDEYTFFQENSIDCLVAKNSGGYASHPKITVARVLAIPVVLLQQPKSINVTKIYDREALTAFVLHDLSR
jgi:precorrin-6A/cobalt-precorrin-6A reductase